MRGPNNPKFPHKDGQKNTALCSGWKAQDTCSPLQFVPQFVSIRGSKPPPFVFHSCPFVVQNAPLRFPSRLRGFALTPTTAGVPTQQGRSRAGKPDLRAFRLNASPNSCSIRVHSWFKTPLRVSLRVSPKPSPPKRPHHHIIQTRQNREPAASGKSR